MMTKRKLFYILAATLTLLLTACNQQRNDADLASLKKTDSLLSIHPEAAADSLQTFSNRKLSRFNSGYYLLLEVIAKDKNHYNFTSDSLISTAEHKLSGYKRKEPGTYARSLMYLGLVRYRMGVTDSTAYIPIKEAISFFNNNDKQSISNKCLCYYYLGEIHYASGSLSISSSYYLQSLEIAKKLDNINNIFYGNRALFWNNIRQKRYIKAKEYLDVLNNKSTFNDSVFIKFVMNDNAVYYFEIKEYMKAKQIDLELFKWHQRTRNADLLTTSFRLSDDYLQMNQLDSALNYALYTVSLIKDTTNTAANLYYLQLAKIAEKSGNNKISMNAYKHAYSLYDKNVSKKTDNQILELEKKYDLTEATNKTLMFRNRANMYGAASIFLILFLLSGIIIWNQQKDKIKKQNIIDRYNQEQLERTLLEKDFIIPIYSQLSSRNFRIKVLLRELLKEQTIYNNSKLLKRINEEYEAYNASFKLSNFNYISEDKFKYFTGLSGDECNELTNREKMLLIFEELKFDDQEIAVLLNTDIKNIRSYHSRLRKKMTNLSIENDNQDI